MAESHPRIRQEAQVDGGKQATREFYPGGQLKSEKYLRYDGMNNVLHREDGPAETMYYENGQKECEKWYQNDRLHREEGPALITYLSDGQIEMEAWFRNGQTYRPEGGSAVVSHHDDS